MKNILFTAIASCLFPFVTYAQTSRFDSSPIQAFELSRYLGTWYEIARFDHSFEKDMDNVTAQYVLRSDGKIDVINSGWKNGRNKLAEGKARQPDPKRNPAHLEVSFFLFFYSDYNVLMIDKDYQVALVGSKDPRYLWILSRTPRVSDEILSDYLKEADSRGYDTGALIWVDQSRNL